MLKDAWEGIPLKNRRVGDLPSAQERMMVSMISTTSRRRVRGRKVIFWTTLVLGSIGGLVYHFVTLIYG